MLPVAVSVSPACVGQSAPSHVGSAMAFNDEIMSHPPLASGMAQRRGRPRRKDMICVPGPPVLCVMVGTPKGRWHAELTMGTAAAREAMRLLRGALGPDSNLESPVQAPAVFGLAVMES